MGKSSSMTEIHSHLIKCYPQCKEYFKKVYGIEKIKPTNDTVIVAVTRTVIGQMLSRKAASTISDRVFRKLNDEHKASIYNLSLKDLLACGLSSRKSRALTEFAAKYAERPEYFENWRYLNANDLSREVNQHWGMSNWTASILGIFYFGNEDIFPSNDGTISKALKLIENDSIMIDPIQCAPYRSYLAMYLWKLVDDRII